MNKVYISGTIYDQPMPAGKDGSASHVVFRLSVSHHAKTSVKRELYRINAWNGCAAYCASNLQKGMRAAIAGYLTQRPVLAGGKVFAATEVTASEIIAASPREITDAYVPADETAGTEEEITAE